MELFLREATERIGVDDPLLDWPGRSGPGPSGCGPPALFKCLLAGQCHGLSAPKRGRPLKVRLDFMLFCGLDLQGSVPDGTPRCRFRHRLVEAGVYDGLPAEVCHRIETRGRKLREAEAAMIAATLIRSAARPRPHMEAPRDRGEEGAKDDPDLHCSADEEGGRGTADAGKARRAALKRQHRDGIMRKAARNSPLRQSEKRFNTHISKHRLRGEPCLGTMKRLFGLHPARCPGGAGTHAQRVMAAIPLNLPRAANRITPDRQTPANA